MMTTSWRARAPLLLCVEPPTHFCIHYAVCSELVSALMLARGMEQCVIGLPGPYSCGTGSDPKMGLANLVWFW